MELRVYDEVEAIKTPTGFIPQYDDLKKLFKEVQNKEYLVEDYNQQFTHRVPENLAKIERIIEIYKTRVLDAPESVFQVLSAQRERLNQVKADYGDYIKPDMF